METVPNDECVAGFVKTRTGCRSVKSLSGDELYQVDSSVAETKIMIERMKESEAANRRLQMAELQAARTETTAATASNYSRAQAPVGFLGERTAAPIPRVTEKAALRNELKESFNAELRSKNYQPGSSQRALGFQ